jgi:multiple antibiotic resistance protein
LRTIPIFITLTSRRTSINIISRLLGLVLAAVAVEFIARGLGQLLPGLAR